MKTPQPEKRRLRVSSGCHSPSRIADIVPYRPFIQQIDLVFPSNPALLEAIQNLRTSYSKGKVKLSDVVDKKEAFVNSVQDQSDLLLVSHSQLEDDIWCIEPYANLALCVSKETYERLGLVGHKLPSKHRSGERYVIGIPLRKNAQSPKNMERVRAALARWDEIRQADLGKDRELWDVVYCSRSPSISISDLPWHNNAQIRHVECETREMYDVHVPTVSWTTFDCPDHAPPPDSADDALDDWNQRIQSMFEWVGMACLGAQRLSANDRVDPFVAIYEPPAPSYIGNVVCLQWEGLLPPDFVKQILDVVTANLLMSSAPPFVAITVHGFTNSPVSYLPYRVKEAGDLFSTSHLPLKSPKEGGEDTWVLLITHAESKNSTESAQTDGELKWCLMDSLG